MYVFLIRWKNVDGRDDVCQCCDSTCHKSSPDWNNKTHLRRLIPEGLLNLLSFNSVTLLFQCNCKQNAIPLTF